MGTVTRWLASPRSASRERASSASFRRSGCRRRCTRRCCTRADANASTRVAGTGSTSTAVFNRGFRSHRRQRRSTSARVNWRRSIRHQSRAEPQVESRQHQDATAAGRRPYPEHHRDCPPEPRQPCVARGVCECREPAAGPGGGTPSRGGGTACAGCLTLASRAHAPRRESDAGDPGRRRGSAARGLAHRRALDERPAARLSDDQSRLRSRDGLPRLPVLLRGVGGHRRSSASPPPSTRHGPTLSPGSKANGREHAGAGRADAAPPPAARWSSHRLRSR